MAQMPGIAQDPMVTSHDRDDLLAQYRDASNLNARIQLHERYSTNPQDWHEWVYSQLDLPSSCCILELGCGVDAGRRLAASPPGAISIASSATPEPNRSPGFAQPHGGRPFSFAVHDVQAIPFADASFDAVLANHMLYHVSDRAQAFREIRRVLVPGGRLYAATNGRAHMRELRDQHERFQPGAGRRIGAIANPFTLENGAEQLEPWFSEVTVRRQENRLHVTKAAPLVAYAASTQTLSEDALRVLAAHVETEIKRNGAIHITKDAGLFTAIRDK
jgi:SAM-dependent methyltransferase